MHADVRRTVAMHQAVWLLSKNLDERPSRNALNRPAALQPLQDFRGAARSFPFFQVLLSFNGAPKLHTAGRSTTSRAARQLQKPKLGYFANCREAPVQDSPWAVASGFYGGCAHCGIFARRERAKSVVFYKTGRRLEAVFGKETSLPASEGGPRLAEAHATLAKDDPGN
ncbi:hypothetical protein KM043_014797 [Ampulex compressa]|nr:hypothetical protein KM043_014797 [Ampulex compressa]